MENRRTLGQEITGILGRSLVVGAALCFTGWLAMAETMDAQIGIASTRDLDGFDW